MAHRRGGVKTPPAICSTTPTINSAPRVYRKASLHNIRASTPTFPVATAREPVRHPGPGDGLDGLDSPFDGVDPFTALTAPSDGPRQPTLQKTTGHDTLTRWFYHLLCRTRNLIQTENPRPPLISPPGGRVFSPVFFPCLPMV